MYRETGNAGLVCTECGISRPTLREWLRRYEEAGEDGLKSQSRRPLNSPKRKISEAVRTEIPRLRAERKGARRIQNELRFHDHQKLSLATIHKVLLEARVKPLVRPRRRARPKRYSRPFPVRCIQTDHGAEFFVETVLLANDMDKAYDRFKTRIGRGEGDANGASKRPCKTLLFRT